MCFSFLISFLLGYDLVSVDELASVCRAAVLRSPAGLRGDLKGLVWEWPSAGSASGKELDRKSELKLNLVVSNAMRNYITWMEE